MSHLTADDLLPWLQPLGSNVLVKLQEPHWKHRRAGAFIITLDIALAKTEAIVIAMGPDVDPRIVDVPDLVQLAQVPDEDRCFLWGTEEHAVIPVSEILGVWEYDPTTDAHARTVCTHGAQP